MGNIANRIISHLALCISLLTPLLTHADEVFTLKHVEELQKSLTLSMRVMDKTRDAKGAAHVLEEAGIAIILIKRPDILPVDDYIKLLHTYAKFLFLIPERFDEVEPLLNKVLKQAPDHYSAYLLMGDVQRRRYKAKPNIQSKQSYTFYYRRYVELLKAKKLKAVLPERVVKAAYGTENLDICAFTSQLLSSNKDYDIYNLLNPETDIEILPVSGTTELSSLQAGDTFREFVNTATLPIRRSLVDIDNDGEKDIRYQKRVEGVNCTRNIFYKSSSEKTQVMSNDLLALYHKAERICNDSVLTFIRFNERNYFFEKHISEIGKIKYTVFNMDPKGLWNTSCTLEDQVPNLRNVSTQCEELICRRVVAISDSIITAKGQGGIERLVANIADLKFHGDVLTNFRFRDFVNSQYIYEVDLDNDGVKELISKVWRNAEGGSDNYEFCLFKKDQSGVWHEFILPGNGKGITKNTWFFVEEFNGKHYIVSYAALINKLDNKQFMSYNMGVYYLQGNILNNVGNILFEDKEHLIVEGE